MTICGKILPWPASIAAASWPWPTTACAPSSSASWSRSSGCRAPEIGRALVPTSQVCALDRGPLRATGGVTIRAATACARSRARPTRSSSPAGATPDERRRPSRCWRRCGPRTRAARAWSRSARASSCWPRPACSTAAAPPRTGATSSACARFTRACASSPTSSTWTRQHPHLRRQRRRHRPLPAPGAARLRRGDRQPGGAAAGGAAAARRRPGAVRPAPVPPAMTGGLARVARVGAAAAGRGPLGRALGAPGRDVAADVRPPLPRGDGHHAAPLAHPSARPGRAAAPETTSRSIDEVAEASACGRRRRCDCISAGLCARPRPPIAGGSPGSAPEGHDKRAGEGHLLPASGLVLAACRPEPLCVRPRRPTAEPMPRASTPAWRRRGRGLR